jgi:hypothetical protein
MASTMPHFSTPTPHHRPLAHTPGSRRDSSRIEVRVPRGWLVDQRSLAEHDGLGLDIIHSSGVGLQPNPTGDSHPYSSRSRHLIQILLTVIALLFGAPFWWDILRRLTGVRSSASISSRRPGRE